MTPDITPAQWAITAVVSMTLLLPVQVFVNALVRRTLAATRAFISDWSEGMREIDACLGTTDKVFPGFSVSGTLDEWSQRYQDHVSVTGYKGRRRIA